MRVLFDHQAFSVQQAGGVSRYIAELIHRLPALGLAQTDLTCTFSDNRHLRELTSFRPLSFGGRKDFKGKKLLLGAINNLFATQKIRSSAFDLFHPSYYDPYFLDALSGRPFVLTVHDMTHEVYPELMHRWDKSSAHKKLLVAKASAIIAISEHTKQALINQWMVPEEKVHVVYHGCSFDSVPAQPLPLPKTFVLYVGKRGSYKNWELVVKAIAKAGLQNTVSLVMAGGGTLTHAEIALLTQYEIPLPHVIQQSMSDAELKYAFQHSLCFVYPSLYEGFGLPILEAYSAGAHVLLSRASCFEEIGGAGALYFDPHDPNDLAELISKAYTSPRQFDPLKSIQSQILQKFSWDAAARNTYAVYSKVLKSR